MGLNAHSRTGTCILLHTLHQPQFSVHHRFSSTLVHFTTYGHAFTQALLPGTARYMHTPVQPQVYICHDWYSLDYLFMPWIHHHVRILTLHPPTSRPSLTRWGEDIRISTCILGRLFFFSFPNSFVRQLMQPKVSMPGNCFFSAPHPPIFPLTPTPPKHTHKGHLQFLWASAI